MRTLPNLDDAARGGTRAAGRMPLSLALATLDPRQREHRAPVGFGPDALKLLMPDQLYEHANVSELAKQRLAIANAAKQRHASTTQLQATLGLRKERILATTDELEAAGLATFDRAKPGQWISATVRKAHAVIALAPEADWNHPANARRRICLPHTVTGKTVDAFKISPSPVDANRVLLYYQREQLKRGAIEVADADLARTFNWPTRKVTLIREWSETVGILGRIGDGEVAGVYVFREAFTIYDAAPERFDSRRTRRLRPLLIAATPLITFASPGELEVAAIRVAQVGDEEALRRLDEAGVRPSCVSHIRPILTALEAPLEPPSGASGNLNLPNREPQPSESGTTTKPRSLEAPERSSHSAKTGHEPREPSEAPGDAFSAKGEQGQVARHEWGAEWSNVWYFSDDEVHAQIEARINSLESTYGHDEARGFLRAACLESKGRARRVLAWLDHRFPTLLDESISEDIAAALDDVLQSVPD